MIPTLTKWRPRVVNVALHNMTSDKQVYWSSQGNSYVVVAATDEDGYNVWRTKENVRVILLSINGGGEPRWSVSQHGSTEGDMEAVEYFDLTWEED